MSSSSILCQRIRYLSPTTGMDDTPLETILNMHENKQGITSIFSSIKPIPSLRRTLSVDMSSRNWLSHDGQPPKGPDHLTHIEDSSGTASDEEEGSRADIWNSIQEDKRKALSQDQRTGEFDVWSSITSRNVVRRSESETIPPQYVYPFVRRSSSGLSEKSLEICTESLGSETGSDGFSSFSPSETRGLFGPQKSEGEKNESLFSSALGRTYGVQDFDAQRSFHAPAAIPRNKQRPRSFPPPLPSLSPAADGASLLMRSRRENGRLVLEAVSVASHKNFQARRENGRLMLAVTAPDVESPDCDFIPDRATDGQEEEDGVGGGCGDRGDDLVEKEGAAGEVIEWIMRKKTESAVEIATSSPHIDYIGKLKFPNFTIMMNKPDEVSKVVFFNEINKGEVEINSVPIKLPQSLRAPAANPLNMYEYVWKTQPCTTAAAVTDHSETTQPPFTLKSYRNTKNYVISHNNCDFSSNDQRAVQILFEDYSKNIVENCWVSVMKDSKRSLFFLQPRCIATS